MKKKTGLYLVSGKIANKEYEVVTVNTYDDCTYQFSLLEWDMYEGEDWVQFRKKDKSVLECFPIHNVSRVLFVIKGGEPVEHKVDLKPVV
jgi:hypothetical protein